MPSFFRSDRCGLLKEVRAAAFRYAPASYAVAGLGAAGHPIGSTTASYVYDGDGKRTSKTVSSVTTPFVYDVNRGLPVLLEDGARRYVWGLGLAYEVESSAALVYHVDGLGSVRALTDSTKAVVQTYESDEFGVPIVASGGSTQPFGFTGEQRDGENGLTYLRTRYYDPHLGRFIGRDPYSGTLSNPVSLNRFVYVWSRPTGLVDPSGLDPGEDDGSNYEDECFRQLWGGQTISVTCMWFFTVRNLPVWAPAPGGGTVIHVPQANPVPPSGGGGGGGQSRGRPVRGKPVSHYREQLTIATLIAAQRELNFGEVVRRRWDGVPFDHVARVRQAQRGLRDRLSALQDKLNWPGLADEDRAIYEEEFAEGSWLLEFSRQFVP